VRPATTFYLEAVAPAGFDFTRATVERPLELPDEIFEDRVFVVNNAEMIRGLLWNVTIMNVRLGRNGGQTVFNLATYADGLLDRKQDELLDYEKGFRLPGEVLINDVEEISGKELRSYFKEEEYETLNLLPAIYPARIEERSRAHFSITFTQPIMCQEMLFIECLGEDPYTLLDMAVMILDEAGIPIENNAFRLSPYWMRATIKPGDQKKLVAIDAKSPITLMVWTMPTAGENIWSISTSDLKDLPSNTNDAILEGFSPVQQVEVEVTISKSPPRTYVMVDVQIMWEPGLDEDVREIELVAPPHFRWPTPCGTEGYENLCYPSEAKLAGSQHERPAALIRYDDGGSLLEMLQKMRDGVTPLILKVETPEYSTIDMTWAVEIKGQGSRTVGWGLAGGFDVMQMPYASVRFPGVLGLEGVLIAISFYISQVDAGIIWQIMVVAPEDSTFEMRCSTRNAIRPLSLPGPTFPECKDENPLTLQAARPLPPGKHSFMVMADVPKVAPRNNDFAILAAGIDGSVIDAAYRVKGPDIYTDLPLAEPVFAWRGSGPNGAAKESHHVHVEFGITLTADCPAFKAIMLTIPKGFQQIIPRVYEVKNLNPLFPAAEGDLWADITNNTRVKIMVDDDLETIPAGVFKWAFPILVPDNQTYPEQHENIWQITICEKVQCQDPFGTWTITTFVQDGFELGTPPRVTTDVSYTTRYLFFSLLFACVLGM